MATRKEPARGASHHVLRPKLLVSVAVAAAIVSIPAIDRAFAFDALGIHLAGTNQGTQTLLPKGRGVIGNSASGVGKLGNVGASGLGKIVTHVDPGRLGHPVGPGVPVRGDPGKGHVVTNNSTDHPQGNVPRLPRWPIPRPHYVPPVVVTHEPPPVIGNPNPVISNPQPNFIQPPVAPRTARRAGGVPPPNETRYVPNEVVIEVATTMTTRQINALAQRHRLAILQTVAYQLGGTTLLRARITDGRAVPTHVQALESDVAVLSAQPNYLYSLIAQGEPAAPPEGDPSQYVLDKMHLPQAHTLATGDKVLVAVIDSGIDVAHPDLAGDIAGTYDAIGKGLKVDKHGTAIAGAIAAHGKLMGAAPAARILAIRAFSGTANNDGTTMAIMVGLNWAVAHGARIVNMSFAGPQDPGIAQAVVDAYARGVILVAATGNEGADSPRRYPAGDAEVIAVTATDENDRVPDFANRGDYVAVAAPGKDVMLLGPNGTYQMMSGTSFSSAYVAGTVALMLERRPNLTPDGVRQALMASAHRLDAKAPSEFGAGLVDAYQALLSVAPVALDEPTVSPTPVAVRP
jgi:hypothetical protein